MLQEYNSKLQHVNGYHKVLADSISRQHKFNSDRDSRQQNFLARMFDGNCLVCVVVVGGFLG